MPVNRPSFAHDYSAIAAAAALEAAKGDKAKQAAELRQAEPWRTPARVDPEHGRDVA